MLSLQNITNSSPVHVCDGASGVFLFSSLCSPLVLFFLDFVCVCSFLLDFMYVGARACMQFPPFCFFLLLFCRFLQFGDKGQSPFGFP